MERKADKERRAFPDFAFKPDLAAMGLDYLARNGKAQSAALFAAGRPDAGARKRLEELSPFRLGDSRPLVADLDPQPCRYRAAGHFDRCVRAAKTLSHWRSSSPAPARFCAIRLDGGRSGSISRSRRMFLCAASSRLTPHGAMVSSARLVDSILNSSLPDSNLPNSGCPRLSCEHEFARRFYRPHHLELVVAQMLEFIDQVFATGVDYSKGITQVVSRNSQQMTLLFVQTRQFGVAPGQFALRGTNSIIEGSVMSSRIFWPSRWSRDPFPQPLFSAVDPRVSLRPSLDQVFGQNQGLSRVARASVGACFAP